MVEHAAAPPGDNPTVGHEKNAVDRRAIARLSAGLTLLVALILGFLLWLFGYFSQREIRRGHSPQGITKAAPDINYKGPRLQITPSTEMADMRAADHAILNSYGWIDKDKGVVRIPIERAMEIITQRGLPTRKN